MSETKLSGILFSGSELLIPRHVAIIMDGNGRWAKKRGLSRIEGHKAGAKSLEKAIEFSRKQGIRYLTVFSFSTENWGRAASEVNALMELFKYYLDAELSRLIKNDIRLRAIGDLQRLPEPVQQSLFHSMEATKDRTGLDLVLAVSYGGREEILFAAKKLAEKVNNGEVSLNEANMDCFRSCLWTSDIPDPDLIIRTSGEMRVSNFLLWQMAYSEIVVINEYWPDFDENVMQRCLIEYSKRERRFGLECEGEAIGQELK